MTVSGIINAIFGFSGMLLNIIVAVAIYRDKDMQNATYKFMIQLALSDVESLFGLIAGAGAMNVAGITRNKSDMLTKILALSAIAGFTVSSAYMPLVAFSRWIYFEKRHLVDVLFTKRSHLIINVVLWGFFHLVCLPYLFLPDAFAPLGDAGAVTFLNNSYSKFSENLTHSQNYLSVVLQIICNIMTSVSIIKLRKQVMTPELRAINNREIKLFIQCAVDSLIYTFAVSLTIAAIYSQSDAAWLSIMIDITLFLNHVDCAIMYLCFNRKLRSQIVNGLKVCLHKPDNSTTPVTLIVNGVPKSDHTTTPVTHIANGV